jgi:hypothetical protein
MRLLISFFIALFLYSAILFFFVYFILFKKNDNEVKVVYVHQVIEVKNKNIPKPKPLPPKPISKSKPISKPKPKQEIKTKDNFSKGGGSFEELFKGVDEEIKTTSIKQKKQNTMTKKKGDSVLSKVQKVKKTLLPTYTLSRKTGSKQDSQYIANEFGKIWSQMDTKPGDFVSLQIDISNGSINLSVIATNLDTILLNKFLTKLKTINTTKIKKFSGVIDFNVKLKD